jgi:hypothetical protein
LAGAGSGVIAGETTADGGAATGIAPTEEAAEGAAQAAAKKAAERAAAGAKNGLDKGTIERILSIPKGMRPDPSEYMSAEQIQSQLAQFETGAARSTLESTLTKYGPAQVDGTAFVTPASQADELLKSTGANARELEQALGLPEGTLEGQRLVRLNVPVPKDLNLRIPSGNEAGANAQWIPGGQLPNGSLEAVIDLGGAPPGSYDISPVTPRQVGR